MSDVMPYASLDEVVRRGGMVILRSGDDPRLVPGELLPDADHAVLLERVAAARRRTTS